jgi:hypothetical protein
VAGATVVAAFLERAGLGAGVGEKQKIEHVVAPGFGEIDLRQPGAAPAQQIKNGPDQFVLGLPFVERRIGGKTAVNPAQCGNEGIECGIVAGPPRIGVEDAAGEEIVGKELTLHGTESSARQTAEDSSW